MRLIVYDAEVKTALKNIADSPEAIGEFIDEAEPIVINRMKENAPVLTGKMRDSIYSRRFIGGFQVGPTAFYALFVEQLPQKQLFVRRTYRETKGELIKIAEKVWKKHHVI